jgi:hypothetical protein
MVDPQWSDVLVAALGSSGLASVTTAWIRSRTTERREARGFAEHVVDDFREALREEREETSQHRARHLECIERVARVEAQFTELRREHDELRRAHSECPGKIAVLERRVDVLLSGRAQGLEGEAR